MANNNKNIVRVEKNKNYTTINNTSIQDQRLSWKAKAIHVFMLSRPDDWVFYNEEMVKWAKDGKDAFLSGLKELKKLGYIKKEKRRNDDGTFDWVTVVYEIPQPYMDLPHMENPLMDKPYMEKPSMENPTLLSTNKPITDSLSTNELNTNQPTIDHGFAKVIDFYEKNISIVRPMTGEKLGGLVDDFTADLVLFALEITASNPKVTNPIKYATSILAKWKENLVTTRQQAEIYESNKRGEQNGQNNRGSHGSSQSENNRPTIFGDYCSD